jgi:hypothetical protein|tara:strand:+ start:61 stop:294 length:234 start_codon:yes stop_codon:yes gene_type:complete
MTFNTENPMSKWMKVLAVSSLFCTVMAIGIAIWASITVSFGLEAGPKNYLDAWLTSAVLVSINMMYIDYWKSFFKKS